MLGSYISYLPRPSSYPLLGPKYLLLGTIYPQLRVQGRSSYLWGRSVFEAQEHFFFCVGEGYEA